MQWEQYSYLLFFFSNEQVAGRFVRMDGTERCHFAKNKWIFKAGSAKSRKGSPRPLAKAKAEI